MANFLVKINFASKKSPACPGQNRDFSRKNREFFAHAKKFSKKAKNRRRAATKIAREILKNFQIF